MSADSERPLQELTYDSSAHRLRQTCRWAGVVLLASPLLPFEAVGEQPVFVWEILAELHPATAVAALAPLFVGAVLLAASIWLARPSLVAAISLLALATWSLVAKLGADAAAWDMASLPDSLGQRVELATLSIALAGAALKLLAEPAAARAARAVSGLAVVSGISFAVWPGDGEAPVQTCVRFLGGLLSLPDFRFVLGYGLILFIGAFPLVAAGAAASLALAGYRKSTLLAEVAIFGLPGLLFVLAARSVLLTYGDLSVVVLTALALVLASMISVTARALELIALWATGLARSSEQERAGRPRRVLLLSAAAALCVAATMFVLSRPVEKGIDWQLAARSEQAEHLYGELLPKWAQSRARWGLAVHEAGSAVELAQARAAANDVLRSARALNPSVAEAVAELVHGSGDLDLAGRRWFHLIEAVNEANRRAKLPFYLDPSVRVGGHQGRMERLFLLYPYRIEGVRPVRVQGKQYALLDVRQLGEARSNHQRLGFSRDFQPFALVVLDEIEPYAASLEASATRQPPSCADVDSAPPVFRQCGALLRQLTATPDAVRKLVARHELQHQIDGPELTHSAAVLAGLSAYDPAAIDEVNRELSAYLAEFVTTGVSPKLALVHTLPFAFARPGSGLHFVAKLQLSALTQRELTGPTEQEVERAFAELSVLPDDTLRERARGAYEALFDAELSEPEPVR